MCDGKKIAANSREKKNSVKSRRKAISMQYPNLTASSCCKVNYGIDLWLSYVSVQPKVAKNLSTGLTLAELTTEVYPLKKVKTKN